jgi:hypothetical protein
MTGKLLAAGCVAICLAGCTAAETEPAVTDTTETPPAANPDKEQRVFEDTFDEGMKHWQPEGPHLVEVTDGRLHVKTPGESKNGQYVWCRHKLPADFRLEWDVTPLSRSGFFLVFFCQEGVKGEDILGQELFENYMNWKTWGAYEDFDKYVSAPGRRGHHQSRIRGYHLSYRRNENANCNFRKNPGLNLLESHPVDALLPKDHTAHAVLTKTGGRVKLVIDGQTFMDKTDPDKPWSGGRFGFRNTYESEGTYDNVKLFDLTKDD